LGKIVNCLQILLTAATNYFVICKTVKKKKMKFYATTLVNKHVNAKTNVKCKKLLNGFMPKEQVKKLLKKFTRNSDRSQ
jgi:hypothetical protein